MTLAKDITRKIAPPRAVSTGFPLGHPLSFPGQSFRQLNILRLLLKQLVEIKTPGTIVELSPSNPDDPIVECEVCA